MATDVPLFHKQKHVQYWLRCLRTPLPQLYTSNDATRMTFAFFTISALDLLGVLFVKTTPEERAEYADWIYRCQHPEGGFRGFPGTDLGDKRNDQNRVWDPAHLPSTYFALASLCVLGDDLARVNKTACLTWLRKLQRPDGSFGELLGLNDHIEGGMDSRFGYCAMGIRWILRGNITGPSYDVDDVRVQDFVECIGRSQTYDGGISEEQFHEAHAGFTYCAVGALSFANRLNAVGDTTSLSRATIVQWLASRLTTTIEEDEFSEVDSDLPASSSTSARPSFEKLQSTPARHMSEDPYSFNPSKPLANGIFIPWTGFSGRCNKIADTCYAFWAGGSLRILQSLESVDVAPLRRYLLEKTQHLIVGGFGKFPGCPPDIYHAYLGLACLALIDGCVEEGPIIGAEKIEDAEEGNGLHAEGKKSDNDASTRFLRALDPTTCFSKSTRRWVEKLHARQAAQVEDP